LLRIRRQSKRDRLIARKTWSLVVLKEQIHKLLSFRLLTATQLRFLTELQWSFDDPNSIKQAEKTPALPAAHTVHTEATSDSTGHGGTVHGSSDASTAPAMQNAPIKYSPAQSNVSQATLSDVVASSPTTNGAGPFSAAASNASWRTIEAILPGPVNLAPNSVATTAPMDLTQYDVSDIDMADVPPTEHSHISSAGSGVTPGISTGEDGRRGAEMFVSMWGSDDTDMLDASAFSEYDASGSVTHGALAAPAAPVPESLPVSPAMPLGSSAGQTQQPVIQPATANVNSNASSIRASPAQALLTPLQHLPQQHHHQLVPSHSAAGQMAPGPPQPLFPPQQQQQLQSQLPQHQLVPTKTTVNTTNGLNSLPQQQQQLLLPLPPQQLSQPQHQHLISSQITANAKDVIGALPQRQPPAPPKPQVEGSLNPLLLQQADAMSNNSPVVPWTAAPIQGLHPVPWNNAKASSSSTRTTSRPAGRPKSYSLSKFNCNHPSQQMPPKHGSKAASLSHAKHHEAAGERGDRHSPVPTGEGSAGMRAFPAERRSLSSASGQAPSSTSSSYSAGGATAVGPSKADANKKPTHPPSQPNAKANVVERHGHADDDGNRPDDHPPDPTEEELAIIDALHPGFFALS
jgi:hypothetical protein